MFHSVTIFAKSIDVIESFDKTNLDEGKLTWARSSKRLPKNIQRNEFALFCYLQHVLSTNLLFVYMYIYRRHFTKAYLAPARHGDIRGQISHLKINYLIFFGECWIEIEKKILFIWPWILPVNIHSGMSNSVNTKLFDIWTKLFSIFFQRFSLSICATSSCLFRLGSRGGVVFRPRSLVRGDSLNGTSEDIVVLHCFPLRSSTCRSSKKNENKTGNLITQEALFVFYKSFLRTN